ncbi:LrgB family protein [Silvimonas soli]|uniref:LrgB family protein n=1 Tax=Silvimonas soli TaxID=2980100 RepID=UPI0024B36EB6|nr:LrgB family protein [Silvimonas soli]
MPDSMLAAGCFILTVGLYYANKRLYEKSLRLILMPLLATPAVLIAIVLLADIPYHDYIADTHWLMWLLGPATIAFALPIYDNRNMVRKHWLSISAGVLAAVVTSVSTSVLLARWLGLSVMLQKGLAVRSVTTPFAIEAARSIGGPADLAAVFVVITGVLGMAIGETVLTCLPMVRSRLAHGAIFGAAAHGAGTAKARQIGEVQGVVSSLVMMIAGLISVLGAPVIGKLFF